jgi:hypothetical protein
VASTHDTNLSHVGGEEGQVVGVRGEKDGEGVERDVAEVVVVNGIVLVVGRGVLVVRMGREGDLIVVVNVVVEEVLCLLLLLLLHDNNSITRFIH